MRKNRDSAYFLRRDDKKKKIGAVPIFIFILLLVMGTARQAHAAGISDTEVRVALRTDSDRISLSIKGAYKIYTLKTNELLEQGRNLRKANVEPTVTGLRINLKPYDLYGIHIQPMKDAAISLDGRHFRGNVDLVRTREMKILVINHIRLDDYLKGVLYHEISHRWPIEAIKTQAIASRTFALYEADRNRNKDFDLTSDYYSQVYGGRTSEKSRTSRGVDETTGQVVTYRGKIFPSYFHSTCGGHTENADLLWGLDLPPLKGVACSYCKGSKHDHWSAIVSFWDIKRKLIAAGYRIDRLKNISTRGTDPSGRVISVIIATESGELEIPSNKFRLAMGPTMIRSTDFTLTKQFGYIYFTGRGWGHGVGMCQWGALGMAQKAFKAEEILKFYYPGVTVEKR